MKAKNYTHGELYVLRKELINNDQDFTQNCRELGQLPKRMSRAKALKYYGDKIKKCFNNLKTKG